VPPRPSGSRPRRSLRAFGPAGDSRRRKVASDGEHVAAASPGRCTRQTPCVFNQSCHLTKIEQSLRADLADYERDLIAARKAPYTVQTYVDRAERFIKYSVRCYTP
jgi:hypothetical protein